MVQMRGIPLHDGLLPQSATAAERAALAERSRARARQQLDIHAKRSFPAPSEPPAGDKGAVQPHTTQQRALACSRRAELHALCCDLLVADKAYMQKVRLPRLTNHLLAVCCGQGDNLHAAFN